MSTRSNIILVTPDNRAHQFYHHYDGYLSGVGEELRSFLVYSIGMNYLISDIPMYNILLDKLLNSRGYEDEETFDLDNLNCLHGDIEFAYVIKDFKLYYVGEYGLCDKINTYKDLIGYACKEENEIDLLKKCED